MEDIAKIQHRNRRYTTEAESQNHHLSHVTFFLRKDTIQSSYQLEEQHYQHHKAHL